MSVAAADDASQHSDRPNRRRNGRSYPRAKTKGYSSSGEENFLDRDQAMRIDMEDAWGENTTCITGNTSEHSYNADEFRPEIRLRGGRSGGKSGIRMRCSRFIWLATSSSVALLAVVSPVAMLALPKVLELLPWEGRWETSNCGPECEGLLINFAFKFLFLLLGIWAVYFRRSLADMPRLFLARAALLALVFLLTFAFWLFYGMRVWRRREASYLAVASFADSLLNGLLWIHYFATVLLELRHLRPEYKIRVVRSPDGVSFSYSLGQLSIQRAGVAVLQNYHRDFPVYNAYLQKLPGSARIRMKSGGGGSVVNAPGSQVGFKLYSVDGPEGSEAGIPEVNAQALMIAAARKRDSGHNDRFYEEIDWERRVKKRKARLITATEEAFSHIKRLNNEKSMSRWRPAFVHEELLGGPSVPMTADEAARAIFPSFARPLSKYLRVTRQQPRHSAEQVVRHLTECLSFDMSARAFLERFFSTQETFEASELETKWSILTDEIASRDISHGTTFSLSCQCPGPNAGVELLCTVSRLPFFNLTEEVFDPKDNKFVLRLSSETSV